MTITNKSLIVNDTARTAAELNLARLVVHRIFMKEHITSERKRQALAVEHGAVG